MYGIGIDVGGTNLRLGVVSQKGELIELVKESTPTNKEDVFLRLNFIIQSLKSKYSISGIGLGWPGPVDRFSGTIRQSPNLKGFENYPIALELKKTTGLPCYIENDAKCAGLGEWRFGAAIGLDTFIVLTFGTGIGGVIFSNRLMIYGNSGGAGEIGHMTLYPNGDSCPCGNMGCFERYCSAKALERKSIAYAGQEVSAKEIVELSEKGELWAIKLISDFTEDLSIAIGSLTNIFNPQAFIFAGGLFTTGGKIILENLQDKIQTRAFSSFQKDLKLIPSKLHGTAGIIGAASLIWTADHDLKSQPRL